MKTSIFILTVICTIFISCKKQTVNNNEKVFEVDVNVEDAFLNIDNTKKQGRAHSGNNYSSIDKTIIYGAGFVKSINDSLKSYNLKLIVSAWVRESVMPCEGAIAISLNKKDGTPKVWNTIVPTKMDANNWTFVSDTLNFKSDVVNEINELKIFAMKDKGDDAFDVDDLKIKYIFYK